MIEPYQLPPHRKPLRSEMKVKLMNEIAILREHMGLPVPLSKRHYWQGWSRPISIRIFERWKRMLDYEVRRREMVSHVKQMEFEL